MHNALEKRKRQMHQGVVYAGSVESAAERLRDARHAAGFSSAKSAAEAMGVSVSTYIQHENGARGIPRDRALRYARFFRTTPEWLLYGREVGGRVEAAQLGPRIPIQGEVAAGVWQERANYPEDEWEYFTGRDSIEAPLRERFGLRVLGDSMDLVYPPGSIIECVRYWGRDMIPNGKRVVVQRWRGDNVETTVKEYVVDKQGVEWLVPRSSNPAFQTPFRCDQPEPGITSVAIIGIVVASIRYED